MDYLSAFAVLTIALHVVSGAAYVPGWERMYGMCIGPLQLSVAVHCTTEVALYDSIC